MKDDYLKYISDILLNPKRRSSKWLSSCFPEDVWDQEQTQFCSAEYFTRNLCNSVLFEETLRKVPSNSIFMEIGPNSIFLPLIKKDNPKGICISITKKGRLDGTNCFLEGLGE